MATFKDSKAKDWQFNLNPRSLRAIREAHQLDLYALDQDVLTRLEDPLLLADVLWICCQSQAELESISFDVFSEGICGDSIDQGRDALLAALLDFCPQDKRGPLKRVIDTTKRLRSMVYSRAAAELDAPEIEQAIKAKLDAAFNEFRQGLQQ